MLRLSSLVLRWSLSQTTLDTRVTSGDVHVVARLRTVALFI